MSNGAIRRQKKLKKRTLKTKLRFACFSIFLRFECTLNVKIYGKLHTVVFSTTLKYLQII